MHINIDISVGGNSSKHTRAESRYSAVVLRCQKLAQSLSRGIKHCIVSTLRPESFSLTHTTVLLSWVRKTFLVFPFLLPTQWAYCLHLHRFVVEDSKHRKVQEWMYFLNARFIMGEMFMYLKKKKKHSTPTNSDIKHFSKNVIPHLRMERHKLLNLIKELK